jgi:putative transposase
MARRHDIPVRQALRKLFPSTWVTQEARATGMLRRRRKIDPVALFWVLILGAGVARSRSLAGLRRSYERATGQSIQESSFYDRFNAELVALLKRAVAKALESSLGVNRALRGPLATFRDVLLTDSTVIRLHDMLAKTFPGCRTNHTKAALKAHVILSVVGSGRQSVKVTSQRAHDGPVLRVGPWVRDRLFLFDLGYFRYQLFACITRNGGYFLSRLKGNADPTIVAVNRTYRGRAVPLVGERLRDVADRLKRDVLDVTVEVEFRRRRYGGLAKSDRQTLRVIGVRNAETKEHHFYITNVPPDKLTAEDVQAVYALRWEVEMVFKELKKNYRVDEIPSRKKPVVEALLYASVLTLVVSRRLLDLVRETLNANDYQVPPRRWAALLESVMGDILLLALRPPREMRDLCRRVGKTIRHEAIDPNKKRPTLLQAVETRTHTYRRRAASVASQEKRAS